MDDISRYPGFIILAVSAAVILRTIVEIATAALASMAEDAERRREREGGK